MTQQRTEDEIFSDLSELSKTTGYIHVVAYFCFKSSGVVLKKCLVSVEDLHPLYSRENLIRTEISTLIGLMMKNTIDYSKPSKDEFEQAIIKTEDLLNELHNSIAKPLSKIFNFEKDGNFTKSEDSDPFSHGAALREPIFYGAESAYGYQYLDFATEKYRNDNEWIKLNKGFTIHEAQDAISSILKIRQEKISAILNQTQSSSLEDWPLLDGFSFNLLEVKDFSGIEETTIKSVITAFTFHEEENNSQFCSLQDFNKANSHPLLQISESEFILLDGQGLLESFYESPFYWMASDKKYKDASLRNRGEFTEEFCQKRLQLVFGTERVYKNVIISNGKGVEVGEIDVLVIFGDRVIILQAKSKRLTLESRKGNDLQIRKDFTQSIQDAYDQGLSCSEKLLDGEFYFSNGISVALPESIKEVYILCTVSDHYPALNFQARQFLKYRTTEVIQAPIILDVFTIDVMTEMLSSPLYLLSYISRRSGYTDKIFASHELTILSFHIRHNLWFEDSCDLAWLDDSLAADLDLAMAVRRQGVIGPEVPDGILSRLKSTILGKVISSIEHEPAPAAINLGFLLLKIGEDSVLDAESKIQTLARLTRQDRKNHDLSFGFTPLRSGYTIHCNYDSDDIATSKLLSHCEMKKHQQKVDQWFGVCLNPTTLDPRFIVGVDYEWTSNATLESMVHNLKGTHLRSSKIGRNDPCSCGSGKKYKKCCLGR